MYRLLIADDEENIRNGIARSLPWQEWGYEVCAVCANGQEVLDQLDACRPDVVLSDIRMPGMDGMELMQRLLFPFAGESLVALYSSEAEISLEEVTASLRELQKAVHDQLRVTLSVGISNLCTEPGMLPQAYEQADCCAKQSAFAGQEQIYQFRQLSSDRPDDLAYFDTERVEKALLAQDYEALRAEVDRVLLLPGTANHVRVQSRPGLGTRVSIELPWNTI